MGGRGSGGGRGGGGISKQPEVSTQKFNDYVKNKLADLNDADLKKQLTNSKNAMDRATTNLMYERNKLQKMNEEFKNVQMTDSDYETKSAALEKQIAKVSEAQSKADIQTQVYYLGVNEKYNVRDKHEVSNLKSMTNGQLNSYYNKSYKEGLKARTRLENTNNAKTRAKYQKLYEEHNQNFFAANAEKEKLLSLSSAIKNISEIRNHHFETA